MDPRIIEIQEILTATHGCHTVILYGSHVRGEASPASDYDLLGIKEDGEFLRDARKWNGTYLDLFVYPESKIQDLDETMLRIHGGTVLVEKDLIGTNLLKRVDELYLKGPNKLPPDEIEARKVWAEKMLDRAGHDDIEANFRRLWLLVSLLEDYFRIRGLWYMGSKESFKWLEKNDPETLHQFDSAFRESKDLELLHQLVQRVISSPNELIVCGRDEVFIWDLDKIENGIPTKTWSWKAAEQKDLPDEYKNLFGSTDECKPFDHGAKILICSSGGGFAYVDRKENRTLFYGKGGNPHSADLLPGNRVAVALSVGGDQLAIYDLASSDQPPLFSLPFPSAHGVVWDGERKILWALSYDELHAYRLEAWESNSPQLVLEKSFPLPDKDGHDFFSVPHTQYLSVTTHAHCWLFDRDTKTFSPHPDLASLHEVKSIGKHPVTGRTVYVKAIKGNQWWSENIRFLNPPADIHIPGEIFYKARWNA